MNYTQYCNSSCIVYYLSKAQVYNIYNENNMVAFTLHPANDELLGGFFFRESETVPRVLPTLSCTVR